MTAYINNLFYVYFFSCIVILNYSSFSKAQKLSLIYLTTFALRITDGANTLTSLVCLGTIVFAVEEYLTDDKVKLRIVSRIGLKILDFIYSFIVFDAGIWAVAAIVMCSESVKQLELRIIDSIYVYYCIAAIFMFLAIHFLNTCKFSIKRYSDIKEYFDKFVESDINLGSSEVMERLSMLTELEDKSYFYRKNSYSWFSFAFIRYKFFNSHYHDKLAYRTHKSICQKIYTIKKILLMDVSEVYKEVICRIENHCIEAVEFFKSIKRQIRGASTLEMQFMRVNAISEGYNCVIRRKFFELVYTHVFFKGLKKFYDNSIVSKRNTFKEFILYVYIYTIPVKINGVKFSSIASIFQDKSILTNGESKLGEFDKEALFIAYLALTGARVSERRLSLYPQTVYEHNIDICRCTYYIELINNRKYTEEHRMTSEEIEAGYKEYRINTLWPIYFINGVAVPYMERGVYYGAPDWPSYGRQNCREFIGHIYAKIWHSNLTSYAKTSNDLLKDIVDMNERIITADNTKRFFLQSQSGAAIRIADDISGNDSRGENKHSQLLVDVDDTGCVIYESTDQGTVLGYYTWEQYAEKYGRYKYYKYIKWDRK